MQPHKDSSSLLSHTAPPPLPGARANVYTSDAVAALCTRFREAMRDLVEQRPELALVAEALDQVVHHDADPLREVESLLTACQEVFVQLKRLVNPIALPLHVTEDGRVLTSTFYNVAVFVTDIRGFTTLSQQVESQWGTNIFQVLSYCYFPYVVDVLDRYDCHYLNYTGDGLLVLSLERRDHRGRVCLASLDNAVLCALELIAVTSSIAEAWKRLGLAQDQGIGHETGVGLASGDVQIGDPFVPDRTASGRVAQFETVLRGILEQTMPYGQLRQDFRRRILGIHALSPVINRASRLQDMDKLALQHTCMMAADDVAKLCPPLRQRFQQVGRMVLRGIGEVEVFGVHRCECVNIPELEKACRRFYA